MCVAERLAHANGSKHAGRRVSTPFGSLGLDRRQAVVACAEDAWLDGPAFVW